MIHPKIQKRARAKTKTSETFGDRKFSTHTTIQFSPIKKISRHHHLVILRKKLKRKRTSTTDHDETNTSKTTTSISNPVKQHTSSDELLVLVFPLIKDVKRLHQEHEKSQPYKHIVLDPLISHEKMRRVQEEAKANMRANLKETDLFKVYQTGDLGNLDAGSMGASLPNLLELRTALYSAAFRKFVEEVTGCGSLTDRTDMSMNAYAQGCHLLCHDDVIGTRCVSYIIYLTDPDEEWTAADGGALELYALEPSSVIIRDGGNSSSNNSRQGQGIPQVAPCLSILPKFNTMAFFCVQPGRSYHSVQEVFSDNSPRLSISGWYHRTVPPEGSDLASLKQIMTAGDNSRPFESYPLETTLLTSSSEESDARYLRQWMNPLYFEQDKIRRIHKTFCKASSIQLSEFLVPELAGEINRHMAATDSRDGLGSGKVPRNYALGVGDGWAAVGPAHKRRYLAYSAPPSASGGKSKRPAVSAAVLGTLLTSVQSGVLRSRAFARYLARITTLETTGYRDEVRRFRPGMDYSVAHYGGMTALPRLDATLCFVDCRGEGESGENDEEKEELWDSGDVGGFECYIEAEGEAGESAEAAEVYRAAGTDDQDTNLLSVSPANNVISLVLRDEGIMRFIKYVSAAAPGSRCDVAVEYEIVQQGEEENSTAEEEEEEDEEL